MDTFSACIYVRDGGLPLKETLESISGHTNETIVMIPADNPLAEKTAKAFPAHILSYEDTESPSTVLQHAFSKSTCDYFLWLDEGDIFTPSDLVKLRTLQHVLEPDIDAVRMKHAFTVDGPNTVAHYKYEIRLLARHASFSITDNANPELLTDGKTATYELTITHRQNTPVNYASGLSYYQDKLQKSGDLSPRDRLFYARALRDSGNAQEAISQFRTLIKSEAIHDLRIAASLELSACLPNEEDQMDTLLHTFLLGPPQADICCAIGAYLQKSNAIHEAIFWYELALSQKLPRSHRTIYSDYWGYIPALELCRCYYTLGSTSKAVHYNAIAGEYRPGDAAVQYNTAFFAEHNRRAADRRT
ncbi:MAG: glycosyltransferase family A protein [Ethanoligenens sp.]